MRGSFLWRAGVVPAPACSRVILLVLVCVLAAARMAPALAADPAEVYRNSVTLTVTDRSGLDRDGWPVSVSVPLRCGEVRDLATFLYLVREGDGPRRAVPMQVLDVVSPDYGEQAMRLLNNRPPAEDFRLFTIGFLADVPANGTSRYQLYYGHPTEPLPMPEMPTTLRYAGNNPGLTIETAGVRFILDPKSGSLLSFVPLLAGVRDELSFAQGEKKPIHYNPDVWSPPMHWGHAHAWDLMDPGEQGPFMEFTQGPLAYRSFRTGPIVRSNGVMATITYTFFADMPFLYASSTMEFTRNTRVNAVRNNQLVFNRGEMTHGVWPDAQGRVQTTPLYDPTNPARVFGTVASLPPDIPWLGMYDERRGFGICVVNLAHFSGAANLADDNSGRWSQYYISDPGLWLRENRPDFAFTYIVRPEIYFNTVVPQGSFFAERSAYLVFKLGDADGRFDELLRWVRLIGHPPVVRVSPLVLPPQ